MKTIEEEIANKAGSYILILSNKQRREIKVGKLATLSLDKGYYIYVGSALGPGGVQARVKRHSKKDKKDHWHIDYLRSVTDLVSIWYLYSEDRFEHQFAELFQKNDKIAVPLAGFGASDCACAAHLFYSKEKPKFDKYKHDLEAEKLFRFRV